MDLGSRSHRLRQTSTDAEQAFWQRVRGRQLGGYKFRRQVPIAWFIADFLCEEKKLVVELDGGHHQEQADIDERRTKQIERHGYRLVRLWNNDVLKNIEGVLETLLAELERGDDGHASPPQGPSP